MRTNRRPPPGARPQVSLPFNKAHPFGPATMSELRRDPFTGRWAVVAEGRSARPNDYAARPPTESSDGDCPFCEGREERTPPEVAAVRGGGSHPNGPGWSVRAIPNRFPTLGGEPGAPAAGLGPGRPERRPGVGVHEVVIESPRHSPAMPYLGAEQLRELFRFLRGRLRAIEARPGIASVLLFENWGPESGGTLWHPHAQLVGTDQIPATLAEEARRFREHAGGTCLLEEVVVAEEEDATRVVFADDSWTVVAPFGSEHPYEMRLVPRHHAPSLSEATDPEVDALARLLPHMLRALDRVAKGASYNWVVHALGPATSPSPSFHWHVEVLPRLVRPDGFELGAGVAVNPLRPEEAAARLVGELGGVAGAGGRKR